MSDVNKQKHLTNPTVIIQLQFSSRQVSQALDPQFGAVHMVHPESVFPSNKSQFISNVNVEHCHSVLDVTQSNTESSSKSRASQSVIVFVNFHQSHSVIFSCRRQLFLQKKL